MARYPQHNPTFKGYELIGSSNLLRFALKYANGCPAVEPKELDYVSGMSVGKCSPHPINVVGTDLLHRIKVSQEKQCIVLLGTNDALLAGKYYSVQTSFNNLRKDLIHIRRILIRRYEKVVFLTVPPIPAKSIRINDQVRRINRFMNMWKQDDKVRVLPFHDVLCLEDDNPNTYLFEKFFTGKRRRPDGIHLNQYGLAVMHEFLQVALLESKGQ